MTLLPRPIHFSRLTQESSHLSLCQAAHLLAFGTTETAMHYHLQKLSQPPHPDEVDVYGAQLSGDAWVYGRIRALGKYPKIRDALAVLRNAITRGEVTAFGRDVRTEDLALHQAIPVTVLLSGTDFNLAADTVHLMGQPLFDQVRFERAAIDRLRDATWHNLHRKRGGPKVAEEALVQAFTDLIVADPEARNPRAKQFRQVLALYPSASEIALKQARDVAISQIGDDAVRRAWTRPGRKPRT